MPARGESNETETKGQARTARSLNFKNDYVDSSFQRLTGSRAPSTIVVMIHCAVRFFGDVQRRILFAVVLAFPFLAGCVEFHLVDPNVRYVAFGDSSTSGPSTRDYPDILRSLLGEAPETFANEGRGGETSEEGQIRLETLLKAEIFPNAEVLLYWQGGGDINEFIREHDPFLLASPDDPDFPLTNRLELHLSKTQLNIESTIAAARDTGLRVYVATYYFFREDLAGCDALPLPVVLPSQAENANAYITRLNQRIREAAQNQGAVLVDVAAADDDLREDEANYFDCNHLSEQGNAIVADLFLKAITAPPD